MMPAINRHMPPEAPSRTTAARVDSKSDDTVSETCSKATATLPARTMSP